MENYCIMVQTGSEEKFKEEATSRLSEIEKNSKVQFYFFKKMMRNRIAENLQLFLNKLQIDFSIKVLYFCR